MKFVIFFNKTQHMNEQTIPLSLFVVFYVKFVAFLLLITIKSSLKLLDSDRLETRTKLSLILII